MCQSTLQVPMMSPSTATPTKIAGCGLDRSCPNSVTSSPSQDIRLDQYQSSIRGSSHRRLNIANRSNSHRRLSIADRHSSHRRLSITSFADETSDHDFEWFDLDAIQKTSDANSDFHAGLVFISEEQAMNEGVEVNNLVRKKDDSKKEFDLLFWITEEELPEDREFREQMEELEQELFNGECARTHEATDDGLRSERAMSAITPGPHENPQGGIDPLSLATGRILHQAQGALTALPTPQNAVDCINKIGKTMSVGGSVIGWVL